MKRCVSALLLAALVGPAALAAERGSSGAAQQTAGKGAGPSFDEALGAVMGRPAGLTADRVAERAVATSPDVQARQAEVQAAVAEVHRALVGYFPRLTLGARYARLSAIQAPVVGDLVVAPGAAEGPLPPNAALVNAPISFDVLLNQYQAQATLSLPLTDYVLRIRPAHQAAQRGREAALLTAEASRRKAALAARLAYYGWVRAVLQGVVAEQALQQASLHLEEARKLHEAGSLAKADVLRAESRVASTELLLLRTRNLAVLLEDRVLVAMHEPAGGGLRIGEDIRPEEGPLPVEGDEGPEGLLREAERARPELRALAAARQAAVGQAQVARAGLFPKLEAGGELLYANPNQRFFPQQDRFDLTWAVSVGLSWSPNEAAAAAFAGQAGAARVAQAAAQEAALRDALRTEVLEAHLALREAEAALGTGQRARVAAEEAWRVRWVQFQGGSTTSLEVIDAQTDLLRARLEVLNALCDRRIARARLLFAVGRR